MNSKTAVAPQLADLFRPDDLQAANVEIWPSPGSFEWWRRKHRAALQAAEAIVEIHGRTFLHGPRTLQVALEQGSRQSASRVETRQTAPGSTIDRPDE